MTLASLTRNLLRRSIRRSPAARGTFGRPVQQLESRDVPVALIDTLFPDATGPQQGAKYGSAVATDGIYTVVGAPNASAGGLQSAGQAFVFDAKTNALVATLNNPLTAGSHDDGFGFSVAIANGVVAVGAPREDSGFGQIDFGAVHLFAAATGALNQSILNPAAETGDQFGYSISLSGNRLLVGTPFDSSGGNDNGRADLYDATTGQLVTTFINPSTGGGDRYGQAVAIVDTLLAIGAPGDVEGGAFAGTVSLHDVASGGIGFIAIFGNPTVSW